MGPAPKLIAVHPILAAHYFADLFIHTAQLELTHPKAHRRTAIATAAGLMKHDRSMFRLQRLDQLTRSIRCGDATGEEGNEVIHRRGSLRAAATLSFSRHEVGS